MNLFALGGDASTDTTHANLLERLFAPHLGNGASGVPLTREEWEDALDVVHPWRSVMGHHMPIYAALTKYAYNEIGPLFLSFSDPAMKVHFLPYMGIQVVRTFPDPRITSQYTVHQWWHCYYGFPLPISTNLDRYTEIAGNVEVEAALATEYTLFHGMPSEHTDGMFNPDYPSLFESLRTLGFRTLDQARALCLILQHTKDTPLLDIIPTHIRNHHAFRGGIATTLVRQAAWGRHDRAWCRLNWTHTRSHAHVPDLLSALWNPAGGAHILHRLATCEQDLLQYDATHDYDDTQHRFVTLRNLLRTAAISLASMGVDPTRDDTLYNPSVHAPDALRAAYAASLPAQGDDPMPLWNVAQAVHAMRTDWEAETREVIKSLAL